MSFERSPWRWLAACLLLSSSACGGAVGSSPDPIDASFHDAAYDAPAETGEAALFPADDASSAADAADALAETGVDTGVDTGVETGVDTGVDSAPPSTCTSDGDCLSAAGAHSCCAGKCVDTGHDLANCGGCGQACQPAHASGVCLSGSCSIGSCAAPFADCDGNAADGCEVDTSSSSSNCGACFTPCAPPAGASAGCSGSACTITGCPAGMADCDHVFSNGCETNLATDPNNCGACGAKPVEVCNLKDDNCNGRCDDVAGCRVAVDRSVNHSTGEHFYTTSGTEAACCGYTVEDAPYYYLYNASQPGLVPFYRCRLASGFHFYTTSATCEGSPGATLEGQMGWIATGAVCGSTPLYRLASGNDHLFTTSSAERASAIAGGYTSEGTAGWVWLTPQG